MKETIKHIVQDVLKDFLFKNNNKLNESININVGGGTALKQAPKQFDNLQWKLTLEQKHRLDDMTDYHPDSFNEEDIKQASKFLKIPEKNLKSILNTYYKHKELNQEEWISKKSSQYQNDSEEAINSRLTIGNKPFMGKDVHPDYKQYKLIPSNKTFGLPKQENNKSKKEQQMVGSPKIIRPKYKTTSKKKNFWLMIYIYSELKPDRISEEGKEIYIDFEPAEEDYDFVKSMLKSNKKDNIWFMIEDLLKEFNKNFKTHYYIHDRHDLVKSKSNVLRYVIAHKLVEKIKPLWSVEERKYIYPEDADYKRLEQQKEEKGEKEMPEIKNIDHQELMKKYMAGDWKVIDNKARWI